MTREELIAAVRTIMSQELVLSIDNIQLDTNLEDLNIDSLDMLKLAVALEKGFDIKINTPELIELKTFGDIIAGLERKLTVS